MRGLPRKREAQKREFSSPRWIRRWKMGEGLGNTGLEWGESGVSSFGDVEGGDDML
jgi:hypothetical protein